MTTLPHLIEALEKATGASSRLNWLIADFVGEIPPYKQLQKNEIGLPQ